MSESPPPLMENNSIKRDLCRIILPLPISANSSQLYSPSAWTQPYKVMFPQTAILPFFYCRDFPSYLFSS